MDALTAQALLRELLSGQRQHPATDNSKHPDTSETVHISPLALIKMLKHARSGVPLEMMGMLLGEFVDEYTIRVVDAFSMPQRGSSVTVESFDPSYQAAFVELVKSVGRTENAVGWYHSHPGFGCWLSSTDLATQGLMEKLHERCVAVVVDPVQSVRGKVVIDAFRSIDPMKLSFNSMAPTGESRQTTANVGSVDRPRGMKSKGIGFKYYSINMAFTCSAKEQTMLMAMSGTKWQNALTLPKFETVNKENSERMATIDKLVKQFAGELKAEEVRQIEMEKDAEEAIKKNEASTSNTDEKKAGKKEEKKDEEKKFEDKKEENKKALALKEAEARLKYGRFDSKQHLQQVSKDILHANILGPVSNVLNTRSGEK